jgi:hypothetical protein
MRNYGHVGPRFVQFLLKNRKKWKEWRQDYQQFVEKWEEQAGDNAIAGRLASCFAAISVTASLVHKAIDLPWKYEDPVKPLWNDLVKEAKDRASAALQHVMACAYAHESEFLGRRDPKALAPTQGWAGRWIIGARPNEKSEVVHEWSEIAFFPQWLDKVLKEGEFEPHSTIRTWKDRGWLRLGIERNGTKRTAARVRFGDGTERMIVVTRKAVDAADGEA